jgi:hypothetical protein
MTQARFYRVYPLDVRGKLRGGEWIEATDDEDARHKALILCNEETPAVEIWQGRNLIGAVNCPPRSDAPAPAWGEGPPQVRSEPEPQEQPPSTGVVRPLE